MTIDDDQRARIATLEGEALSDFLAKIDAAEIADRARVIVMADAARWYVQALGWPVFPLIPRAKRPLTANGFKDASLDPAVIAAWWERWPEANIGTPTGATGCGWDVIDIDGVEGFASLANLKHRNCPPDCASVAFCDATGVLPPIHARSFTPGDPNGKRPRMPGRHYFTPAAGSGNGTKLLPGIDIRGDGGYVVLPPSIGPSGTRYTWITRP